ncbi:hypothetical protein FRC03_009568 [Tulasnella sp. 419]|nr:hypothetical protein FRC03_009568 [Tulasnella sp. 419]
MAAAFHNLGHWDEILMGSSVVLGFSSNGCLLAAADSNGALLIVDTERVAPIHLVQFPPRIRVTCIFWASRNTLFLAASDGLVAALSYKLVGENYAQQLSTWLPRYFPDSVSSIAFSDSNRLLAVGFGNMVEVWKQHDGSWTCLHHFQGDAALDRSVSLIFMPTNDLLMGFQLSGICIWRSGSDETATLPGLRSSEIAAASLADSILLVSFTDGRLGLYRITSLSPYGLIPIQGWPDDVDTLADRGVVTIASRAGRTLIVAEQEGGTITVLFVSSLSSQFQPSIPQDAPEEVLADQLRDRMVLRTSAFVERGKIFVAMASSSKGNQYSSIRVDLWSPNVNVDSTHQRVDPPTAIQLTVFSNLLDEEFQALIPNPPVHSRFYSLSVIINFVVSGRWMRVFLTIALALIAMVWIALLRYEPGTLAPPGPRLAAFGPPPQDVDPEQVPPTPSTLPIIFYSTWLFVRDLSSLVLRAINGILSISPTEVWHRGWRNLGIIWQDLKLWLIWRICEARFFPEISRYCDYLS